MRDKVMRIYRHAATRRVISIDFNGECLGVYVDAPA